MARFGDICKFQSGGTPSKSESSYYGGSIPWVTTVALNGNIIGGDNAVEWITEKALKESAAKLVPANSIMVGTRVGVGKVAINSVPMATCQDIISLLEIDEAKWDKSFLCKWISSQNEYLQSQARGATIKGIKIETIAGLEIPEIKMDTQRSISAILDKVSNLISFRKQQLAKLDELVKARFVEMFGDLISNTRGWSFQPLSLLCDVRDGTHDSPPYVSDGYPLLTSKNFSTGVIDFSGANLISKKDFEKINQRSKVSVGDIVMPMIGTIGHPVIVDTTRPFAIKNVALVKFSGTKISNVFVKYILDSEYFLCATKSANRGGTQKFIALGDIRNFPVPIVPDELQKKFAEFVEQTNGFRLTIQKSLDKLEVLKKALMQEYFG